MKRTISILLSALLLLALCGCTTQKDYDVLAAERDELAAQVEKNDEDISTLQAYAQSLQEEIKELEEELETAQAAADEKEVTIGELTAQVEELQQQLEESQSSGTLKEQAGKAWNGVKGLFSQD